MAEMKFNMLEIDLTSGKKKVVDVTADIKKFIGGRGFGGKLLWERVPPGADPLGPENVLYFGVGPLTGFFGSVVNVSAKSPLTLLRGLSNMNGHFGSELVNAGYGGGLLLTGKANRPVYILIKDKDVEIRDAKHLWGQMSLESQVHLKEELYKETGDQNFRVASIGPGGENLVRNADIAHDLYHHAARLGMGTVMGSKNVKAIAIRGTSAPTYAQPQTIFDMLTSYFHASRLYKAENRRWGHAISMPNRYYSGQEGIKNKQLGWDPICDLSNPLTFEQAYKVWNDSCHGCHVACKVPYMRREPPLGPVVGELRHDDAGGWNANVMIPGFETQMYLTPLVDNLGLDNEDVSGVVAWVMELYDRGILSRKELDGIDLTWGNLEAISKLVGKIARREGIGDILAEGLKFAPLKIGRGSEKYAMTYKGVAITSYEPRGSMSDAVGLAVNPCGELHGNRGDPEVVMTDSLTTCLFLRATIAPIFNGFDEWATQMLNATCGWSLTKKDWPDLTQRMALMERCYSLREGYIPLRDDGLPDRFFDETIQTKYGVPLKLDRDKFMQQKDTWYSARGLTAEGLPKVADLERLGLSFAVPIVEKASGKRA